MNTNNENLNNQSVADYDYVPLRGVAISGAEAGSDVSYAYIGMPSLETDMQYYIEQGMNTIRFPIKWSYITNNISDAEASVSGQQYLETVKASITDMLDAGLTVMLDLHSYMRFAPGSYAGSGNNIANAQDMYNVWSIISEEMKDVANQYPDKLILEIANEPNSMSTMQVLENNNAGIAAVRDAGLTNMVVIQGNSWSGLHSWNEVGSSTDGLSNAQVFIPENIIDPLNNYAISVHQYVDWNGSGSSSVGQSLENFKNYANIDEFMEWVREHDVKVILGEFGGSDEANSLADVNYLLEQVDANPYIEGQGGFIGWAAWVGGHTWAQYNLNYIGPEADGSDSLQMTEVYLPHLVPLDGDFVIPDDSDSTDTNDQTGGDDHSQQDNNNDSSNQDDSSTDNLAATQTLNWDWGARDTIQNFNVTTDALNLQNYWTSYDRISLSDDGQGNTIINLLDVDNRLVTLQGVSLAELTAANLLGVSGNFDSALLDQPAKFYSFDWNYGLNTTINDFNIDSGIIELNSFSDKNFSQLEIYNDANGDAIINLTFNNQLIKLVGVDATELTANNFYGLNGNLNDATITIDNPVIDDPVDNSNNDDPVVDDPVDDSNNDDPVVDDPVDDSNNDDPVVDDPVDDSNNDDPVVDDPVDDSNNDDPVVDDPVDDNSGGVVNQPTNFYSFTWNWGGSEVVNNFDASTDGIDLTAFWTNFDNLTIQEDGEGNVVIDMLELNNQTITLEGTSLEQLSAENFKGIAGQYDNAISQEAVKYYNYSWNYGADSEINDFNIDTGVINLSAFGRSFNDIDIYNNGEGDAIIDLAFDNQTITLAGVDASEINSDNFYGV